MTRIRVALLHALVLAAMEFSVVAFGGCGAGRRSSQFGLNMATSSRDLKSGKKTGPSRVASRLAKAAREASRQAELKRDRTEHDESSSESSSSWYRSKKKKNGEENLSTLINLTEVINHELMHPRDGYRPSSTPMRKLLEHNARSKENKNTKKIKELYHVAIVFSKPLWKDQITTEYASRLTSLARAMKHEKYKPVLICFSGSAETRNESLVASTSAGIIFFRQLCAANKISLDGTEFCIAEHDGTELNCSPLTLRPIVEEFKHRRYLEHWLEASSTYESATDEYGLTRNEPRKKIHIHWTLVSTEYHLCSLNDIHLRSPRQSPLNGLLQDFDHAMKNSRGIVRTTWCFRYTTYPYLYSQNQLTAFLGKCYLLSQGLWPLLINIRGVVKQAEFFQRDNYRSLVGTRRSLVSMIEEMNEAFRNNKQSKAQAVLIPPNLRAQLQKSGVATKSSGIGGDGRFISTDVALESALLSLGRCVDLVRPAGTLSSKSVSLEDWKQALIHLEHFLDLIERACDPDSPLPAADWGKLPVENATPNKPTVYQIKD